MDVRLLGTSGAEGWPALFCRCEACGKARQLGGKNLRTRATSLIDNVLKIDFPPDTLHHVHQLNLDLSCLQAILFTHAHDDHFAAPELQYLGHYFVHVPVAERLPIYGPRDVTDYIATHLDLSFAPLELISLEAWKTVAVGDYRVTPILAQHDPTQTCFNYIIEDAEGAILLYASDTGWYHEPTWEFLSGVRLDGVVAECAKGPIEGGYMAHMCIPEVIRMREKLIAMGSLSHDAPFATTHFSHLGGLLHDELEARLNPHHIEVGYDGMRFTVLARTGVPVA